MPIGFSIYDALLPFAGQTQAGLSEAQAEGLVARLLAACRRRGDGAVLVRAPGADLGGLRGFVFLTEDEALNVPPALTVVRLSTTDVIANEGFVISNSPELPLLAVTQWTMSGYNAFVSIDQTLIEMARTVLAQYDHRFFQLIDATLAGHFHAGQFLAELVADYDATLISSWVSHALGVPAANRLEALQHALGASYCAYGALSSGQRTGGQQHAVRVQMGQGEPFIALASAADAAFEARCYVAAGVLQALPAQAAQPTPSTRIRPKPASDNGVRQVDFSALPDALFDALGGASNFDAAAFDAHDSSLFKPAAHGPLPNGHPQPQAAPDAPTSATTRQHIGVPDASIEVLDYVNEEISYLRDRIMDAGLYRLLDPKPREVLDTFIERSGDLVLLLDEITYLQRMVEQVQQEAELLNPYDMLNAIVMTYSGEAERRGVALGYAADDHLPDFWGNAEAINRALIIVLEQAIEHAAPNGTVVVGGRAEAGHVLLFTQDSATPLTDDAIQALFKPRFKVQSGAAHLGFAALKPIVQAHGGDLLIKQTPTGNLLGFRLPLEGKQ